jgi:transcriptional regulator with XRE-family HTH domain
VATAAQRQEFAERLRQARDEVGLSQRALAEAMGIAQASVAQWESGKTAPRHDKVVTLEHLLRLDTGALARLLGYLPAGQSETKVAMTVIEAAQADPRLGDRERAILAAVYRELVQQARREQAEQAETGAT